MLVPEKAWTWTLTQSLVPLSSACPEAACPLPSSLLVQFLEAGMRKRRGMRVGRASCNVLPSTKSLLAHVLVLASALFSPSPDDIAYSVKTPHWPASTSISSLQPHHNAYVSLHRARADLQLDQSGHRAQDVVQSAAVYLLPYALSSGYGGLTSAMSPIVLSSPTACVAISRWNNRTDLL